MSVEQAGSGAVAAVVQELTRLEQHAAQARQVLVICGGARPALLTQLRGILAPIGIECVEIEPRGQQEYFDSLPAAERVPVQSFAELLASPALAQLMNDPLPAPALVIEQAVADDLIVSVSEPEPHPVEIPSPAVTEVVTALVKPDMTKPINWKRGDIFSENPKFTLQHMRREWFIKAMDVSDRDTLTGIDIEIERVNANRTELLTIEQFMRSYVFVRHADADALPVAESTAE